MKLVKIISHSLKLGILSGFVPWIDFEKNELIDTKFAICISILVIIATFVLNIFYLILAHVFEMFLITLIWLCTYIRSIYIKRKDWKNLIQLYKTIDYEMNHQLNKSLELGWRPVVNLMTYIMLSLIIRIQYYLSHTENIITLDVMMLMLVTTTCFSLMVLKILLEGFKLVTKLTKHLQKKTRWNSLCYHGINAVLCKNLYKYFYDMSYCLNEIFGWLWGLFVLHFLFLSCLFVNFLTRYITRQKLEDFDLVHFAQTFVLYSVSDNYYI